MTLRQWLYHIYWWLRMLPLPRHDDHLWAGTFNPDDPDPDVEVWDCHCGAHWEELADHGK